MYRGFDLDFSEKAFSSAEKFEGFYKIGLELHSEQRKLIKSKLDDFLTPRGAVAATDMQENWFSQIKSHIFISHSHTDRKLAVALAGFLKSHFGVISFIDSCAWGYADDLLRIIDNELCWSDDRQLTYNYSKRNQSTSHVHMMLSTALSMMIDNSECLFFLNTPSSIKPGDIIGSSKTLSPWIYSEIAMTKILRKRTRDDHRGLIAKMAKAMNERLDVDFQYDISLEHLSDLTGANISAWEDAWMSDNDASTPHQALDILYELMDS